MALTGERDYQSSVLWFLNKSSVGNAPGRLGHSKVERLVTSLTSFVTAYARALIETTADKDRLQSATRLWNSSVAYGNEATVQDLIEIVRQVNGFVDDVLSNSTSTHYHTAVAALKNLILEFINVADSVRDDELTKAVLGLSKPYSVKLREVNAESQKGAAEHAGH